MPVRSSDVDSQQCSSVAEMRAAASHLRGWRTLLIRVARLARGRAPRGESMAV
jgi:hypothetical protein